LVPFGGSLKSKIASSWSSSQPALSSFWRTRLHPLLNLGIEKHLQSWLFHPYISEPSYTVVDTFVGIQYKGITVSVSWQSLLPSSLITRNHDNSKEYWIENPSW
jgi:hypothetical protein